MKIERKICVSNFYSGSNWNYEKTTKYIINYHDRIYEAGYFAHYQDQTLRKTVIELPQTYGCPTGCRFCAVSSIHIFEKLDADAMDEMFQYIYEDNKLSEQKYVLLTMTGMGDIYFNFEQVQKFLLRLSQYKNVHVTVSSCLWNPKLLQKMDLLSQKLPMRNIQITYVTDEAGKLERIIPYYQKQTFQFDKILDYIKQSDRDYYRINYIAIGDVNDDREDFQRFADNVKQAADKIIVRVSMLNETGASRRNGLRPVKPESLRQFSQILQDLGVKHYIFYAHKNDQMNCGQLITEMGKENNI